MPISWAPAAHTVPENPLKAEIDADAWTTLHSTTSRPFPHPEWVRIAVKVINHLGMKL